MPDKLSESNWISFTKKQAFKLEDGPLLKALSKLDKIDEAKFEARLDALKDLVEQVKKQIIALAKRKKELGDKPFGLAKDKLDEFLDLAEDLQKKTREAAADVAEQAAEETDSPVLLTTKMVPLLRELRKGEAEATQMHALIGTAGKATAVLIMRRAISPSRRKLLAEALNATGGAKYTVAECLFENKVLTFVVKAPAAGLAKRIRLALVEQTEMRLKVKVRGDDGEDSDGEDGGDDQPGAQPLRPQAPPMSGAERVETVGPSAEQLRYEAQLQKLEQPLAQALRDKHPAASKLSALMGFASEKADEKKDYLAALQALGALEKLLSPVAKPQPSSKPEDPEKPEGLAEPVQLEQALQRRSPAGPVVAGLYSKMKARVSAQLDAAANRNPMLAEKIRRGLVEADALSVGNDDPAAVVRLRALVKEVEDHMALDRQEIQARMDTLYDKATQIRLELNPDADTVRFSVRGLVKAWDLDAAKVILNSFEKAIEKAKPLDFENLNVVQERRAKQFRKEGATFARNTEQALLAAKRVVDDQGNLVLDGGPLKGLPFVRTNDLAAIAEEIAATGEAGLPQSVHALQMLQRLQTDKGAQEALKLVKAPPDPSTATTEEGRQSLRMAQALIRNSLGLADDAPITDVEAKRAAMAALLAQVRQVDIGSCFATASAVRAQRNNPEQFLADMAEMLSSGKLTRTIEWPVGTPVQIEVPISLEMISRKVDVARQNANLHKKPGMVAGLDALGIEDADHEKLIADASRRLRAERALAKALGKVAAFLPGPDTVESMTKAALRAIEDNPLMTIEAALRGPLSKVVLSAKPTPSLQRKESNERKQLAIDCCKDFDDVSGADDFTPQALLEQIGKSRPDGGLPPERIAAAKAAYDTSHDNTLNRAWEYTVASMGEKHPGQTSMGMQMTEGIGDAARSAVEKMAEDLITADGLTGDDADNERTVANEVSTDLSSRLSKELSSRYDPGVGGRSEALSTDGNSSSGGYSLFFRGKKIDGQATFEDMVRTLLEETKQNFDGNALGWPIKYVNKAKALADKLKNQCESKEFRDSVVDSLTKGTVTVPISDPEYNKKFAEQKDRFNTPWTMKQGGYDGWVMQLYDNRKTAQVQQRSDAFTYKVGGVDTSPNDAEGVAHFVLDMLLKIKVADRLPDGPAAERAIVPVANNYHSFSITPGSPDLAIALKQGKKPEVLIAELKALEGAKNEKRRAVPVPLGDLSAGFAASGIAQAANLFADTARAAVIATIKGHFTALGAESVSLDQFKAELKKAMRQVLDTSYAHIPVDQREVHATDASGKAVTAERLLDRVVPKEEYEPLIEAAMRKLSVPEASHDTIKKAVLKAVTQDGVMREDFAKAVRIEMRKLGLGDGSDDLKLTRQAYDTLTTDEERVAALKAAGKTVASPAASYDALKAEDATALREHGVCARLDGKLDKSLVEPRGLVFADTNWGDGDHVTKFAMVVNPLSDPPKLEMWQMNEDGSDARNPGDDWVKNNTWRGFTDPSEYGGVMGGHEVTTPAGPQQWEILRAELRAKLDDFVVAGRLDVGKLQGILDIADTRFADSDFAAADKAINKLATELTEAAPQARLTGAIAKGIRMLDSVAAAVNKEVEARRQTAKGSKLKMPTSEVTAAIAAAEVVGGLIRTLRSGIKTPEDLSKFVVDRKDLLDYIDAQSPTGATNLVTMLTA